MTANFDAEVTATDSVTINDKVYTAKDSLTIVMGEKSSTLTGGTIALDSEVLVIGGKSMKFTPTDDVKILYVTISEDVIKNFNVTAGKFEILGTENADNISVTVTKNKSAVIQLDDKSVTKRRLTLTQLLLLTPTHSLSRTVEKASSAAQV